MNYIFLLLRVTFYITLFSDQPTTRVTHEFATLLKHRPYQYCDKVLTSHLANTLTTFNFPTV